MAKDMILIHGTWGTSESWDAIKGNLEALGFDVHAPSLRFHDLPYDEVLENVGDVSLVDFVTDIIADVQSCDEPPIIVGHSLGCLLAQMVAERVEVAGMILLGPAPTADIPVYYPTMLVSFLPHFFQPNFWKKPMEPNKKAMFKYAMPNQTQELKERVYNDAVPESGKAYFELGLPFLDVLNTATVDHSQVNCPILIVTGSEDVMTVPAIAVKTARNYGDLAKIVMIDGADHYYIEGKFKDQVVFQIKRWVDKFFA